MTPSLRRRITLQLTPLLDLLLIVMFAQYMEMRDLTRQQANRTQAAVAASNSAETQLERNESRLMELNRAMQTLAQQQQETEAERVSLAAALAQARGERDRMAALASEALHIPDELVRQALSAESPEAIAQVQTALKALPASRAPTVVKELLVFDELRRACDLWEVHIDDTSVVRVSDQQNSKSFRADTAAEFDEKFFAWYKTLPPPKSMVIIHLTWSDATFRSRLAARLGLATVAERMRADRNHRTLFEFVVIGYQPNP